VHLMMVTVCQPYCHLVNRMPAVQCSFFPNDLSNLMIPWYLLNCIYNWVVWTSGFFYGLIYWSLLVILKKEVCYLLISGIPFAFVFHHCNFCDLYRCKFVWINICLPKLIIQFILLYLCNLMAFMCSFVRWCTAISNLSSDFDLIM
jgi:hypothetical protein